MIDIRELRRDPDRFVGKLARKGAEQIGRELLRVDAAWRATTARVESLRAHQKEQTGRPSEQELQELARLGRTKLKTVRQTVLRDAAGWIWRRPGRIPD